VTAYPGQHARRDRVVTAPGVTGVIASIAAPPEGVYEVVVHVALTGTAETATNLRSGRTPRRSRSCRPCRRSRCACDIPQVEVNAGGGNLDVVAIAAATAGAIYNVTLIATRIG
jgi:hypothetical protein